MSLYDPNLSPAKQKLTLLLDELHQLSDPTQEQKIGPNDQISPPVLGVQHYKDLCTSIGRLLEEITSKYPTKLTLGIGKKNGYIAALAFTQEFVINIDDEDALKCFKLLSEYQSANTEFLDNTNIVGNFNNIVGLEAKYMFADYDGTKQHYIYQPISQEITGKGDYLNLLPAFINFKLGESLVRLFDQVSPPVLLIAPKDFEKLSKEKAEILSDAIHNPREFINDFSHAQNLEVLRMVNFAGQGNLIHGRN